MQAVAFALPLLQGKTETDRSVMRSLGERDRKAEYEAARKRVGVTREAVFIQATPAGDFAVVYMEAEDLATAFKEMATSEEPFDRFFRDHLRDVHGISLEDGFPPPEQVLDYRS